MMMARISLSKAENFLKLIKLPLNATTLKPKNANQELIINFEELVRFSNVSTTYFKANPTIKLFEKNKNLF